MFGESKYRTGDQLRSELNMLARVLNEAFDVPVAGYEELMHGLVTLLDIADKNSTHKVETPEDFKSFQKSNDTTKDAHWTYHARVKIALLTTFYFCDY